MADPTRRSTRFSMRSKQLGQLLIENGDVQSEQIAAALELQEQQGGLLGQILQQQGVCQPTAIAGALLKQVQVTDVKCEELAVQQEVSGLVSREFCEAERLCPFEMLGTQLLCIVMGNPLNRRAISQIEQSTHFKVKSFKSVWPKINELIQRTYDGAGAPAEQEPAAEEAAPVQDDFSIQDPNADPVIEVPEPQAEAPAPVEQLQLEDEPEQPMVVPTPNRRAASAPAQPAAKAPAAQHRPPPAPTEAKITGFDQLDESNAEVIETNRRGLSARPARATDEPAQRPKAAKVAKVNVDLDALDITSGEVVKTGDIEDDEQLEEMSFDGVVHPVPLKLVHDSYFYENGKLPFGDRSHDLQNLVAELFVAETVAQSIGEFNEQRSTESKKVDRVRGVAVHSAPAAAAGDRPLELQPCPVTVMSAVPIPEIEFQHFTAKLGEDPVGEWDWQFAAAGPIPVLEYEEN